MFEVVFSFLNFIKHYRSNELKYSQKLTKNDLERYRCQKCNKILDR
jgi:hypothetical protein